jgi:hypothetical protein
MINILAGLSRDTLKACHFVNQNIEVRHGGKGRAIDILSLFRMHSFGRVCEDEVNRSWWDSLGNMTSYTEEHYARLDDFTTSWQSFLWKLSRFNFVQTVS